jgi:hypothetical protein
MKKLKSSGSICGGTISYSEWKRMDADELMGVLMSKVKKRIHTRSGHYRYEYMSLI